MRNDASPPFRIPVSAFRIGAAWVALAAIYFAAGKLGLTMAFVHALASPVWPPTGIAIAALLVFGVRLWPGIFAGAFLVNLTAYLTNGGPPPGGSLPISMAIATGNTLEAVVACALVSRFANGRHAFERPGDLLRFVLLAGLVSTTISATIGVSSLVLAGAAAGTQFPDIWITWWLGDAAGATVVTPFLTLWARPPRAPWLTRRRLELVVFSVSLILITGIVFQGWFHPSAPNVPLAFLCLPFFIWAGFRFSQREAATSALVVSALAIRGTLMGFGPFVRSSENASLLLLQAFIGLATVMSLAVGALVTARRRVEDQVRTLHEALAERQRAELAAAQAARREAEDANRAKDEFLATLSHELRTPLTAILGWIALLRQQRHDDSTQRALSVIDRNARVQARLVDDLLDVSQIVTARMKVRYEPVDLTAVVANVCETKRPAAEQKGIALGAELPAAAVPVLGDAARLHQVVSNVLSNAVKFTNQGTIDVTLRRRDDEVELDVVDTGIGISPDMLPLVFERFRQADSSITREHGGLGLGLAIVRHIVEVHGGRVTVRSDGLGRGTSVVINLPVFAGATDRASGEWHRTAGALQGVRVAAVEDQEDTLELVVMTLQRAGASVDAATTARMALHALDRQRPDVLVVDIGLPDEDGYSFLRQARERGHNAPALALTAYASADDRRRALQGGFQAHMAKPFTPSELVAAIAKLAVRTGAEN